MPNIIEALQNVVNTIVDDEPAFPLNIMEASNCWMYYTIISEAISFEQAGLCTTTDDELIGILKDAEKLCTNQSKQLMKFMRKEAITLPPVTETKPITEPQAIPPGVKLTDEEISNGLALKLIAMTVLAATAAAESVRTDVGLIWGEFLSECLVYGTTLKTKMRKRGWAKNPPDYAPPGVGTQ